MRWRSAVASVRRTFPWLRAALVVAGLVGASFLVVREVDRPAASVGDSQMTALPTRTEAEALLADAHRLAQAPNHADLCQTVAQNPEACQKILEWADQAHAMPSAESPSVVGTSTVPSTPNSQGATVLHIQGSRADGTVYTSDFSAVRTTSGQVRSQNSVYWYSNFDSSGS